MHHAVIVRNNNVLGSVVEFDPLLLMGSDLAKDFGVDMLVADVTPGNCEVMWFRLNEAGTEMVDSVTYKDAELYTDGSVGPAKVRIGTSPTTRRRVKR